MTNGDRIRRMDDDEIADVLINAIHCGTLIANDSSSEECRGCKQPYCTGGIVDWLQMDEKDEK